MSRASEPLSVGRTLAGRYELVDVIGQGVSGTVYLALDHHPQAEAKRVALKAIHRALCRDRQIVGRFHREATILKRVRGAHLTRLVDFCEEDDLLFIVLEHIGGPSLEQVLRRRRPLGIDEATSMAVQVCQALESVHRAGVIHRDLKPANVLLHGLDTAAALPQGWEPRDRGGPLSDRAVVAKVVDFGLSKVLQGEPLGSALTEQDMIFGTPEYMSPEQVRGDELDPRCDVYAVGVMLYEMLAGEVPFCAATPLGTMSAHLHEPVPELAREAVYGEIAPTLAAVVRRALDKDRDERFASAEAMAKAIAEAIAPAPRDGPVVRISSPPGGTASTGDPIALGATLQSLRDPAIEAQMQAEQRPRVRVLVEEAAAASPSEATGRAASAASSSAARAVSEGSSERRFWWLAAILAAIAAVVLGVLAGTQ